jgi:hypothetical protein
MDANEKAPRLILTLLSLSQFAFFFFNKKRKRGAESCVNDKLLNIVYLLFGGDQCSG